MVLRTEQILDEKIKYESHVGVDSIGVTARKGLIPVGCVDLSRVNNNTFYFNRLFIHKNFRGAGHSHKLMKTAFAIIDDKECDVILDINPYGELSMNKLIKFYKRYGFTQSNNKSFIREYKKQKTRKIRNPLHYYHGTSGFWALGIMKDGLRPVSKQKHTSRSGGKYSSPDYVYLTDDWEVANTYAREMSRMYGGNPIIFLVEPPKYIRDRITIDPLFHNSWKHRGSIPKKYVRMLT